jgi:hypothetical protein
MNDHDDELDRALAALPLEEPPPGLHARIMTATVYRPAPIVRTWELWLCGTLVAVAAWLVWLGATAPHAGERVAGLLARAIDIAGLDSPYTLLWLAIGVSAAWWISQLSLPAPRRIRIR